MAKVSAFLDRFDEHDARWLAAAGTRRDIRRRDIVVPAGQVPSYLLVVLSGELAVSDAAGPATESERVPAGGVLAPVRLACDGGALVIATRDGEVLCIPTAELERRKAADPAFALRLRRAVAAADRARLAARAEPEPAGRVPPRGLVPELIESMLRGL